MKGVLPSPSFRESKTAAVMAAAAADAHLHETPSTKMKVKSAVGCLPGILFFFQRHHHSHSRKRLSSGSSRSEKASTPTATPPRSPMAKPPPSAPAARLAASDVDKNKPTASATAAAPQPNLKRVAGSDDLRRSSCSNGYEEEGNGTCAVAKYTYRTPSIPQELRLEPTKLVFASPPLPDLSLASAGAITPRSSTATTATNASCRSPALVARLMGLEGLPPAAPQPPPPESASEKRRKLLTALEKCDEDLQALRKIIEALRIAEVRKVTSVVAGGVASKPAPPRKVAAAAATAGPPAAAMSERRSKKTTAKPKPEKLQLLLQQPDQEPSPVSVLDAGQQHLPFGSPVRTRGEWHERRRLFIGDGWPLLSGMTIPRPPAPCANSRWICEVAPPMYMGQRWRRTTGSFSNSKGMVESVGEVCDEGLWEERWERGRLGQVMEGDIFWDLVEEVVEEMMRVCRVTKPVHAWPSSLPQCGRRLPYDACRRRLRF